MNIQQGLDKLYSLHTFGIKLGLENITRFMDIIGNPQDKLKIFHIAGSNGKGSTSAFIASILKELKYKVGLYTSPHFVRFNERIKIGNVEIPDTYVADFISTFEKHIDDLKLTFFEVTTALAFKYFADQKVQYAVIETGLGGRLDATNVIKPCAVIITSISLEHTAILGNTIKEIAGEKAGIIKNKSKVFIGLLPEEAENVILQKCDETNSALFRLDDNINRTHNSIELYTEEIELDDWTMPLKGDYQKYNAALAGLAVSKILDVNDYKRIQSGIKNVITNTGIQGRYEFYNNSPDIIMDSAHNPESINNFLSEFSKDYKKYNKRVLLFCAMKDKAVKEMLSAVSGLFDDIYVTHVNIDRSSTIEGLVSIGNELNIKLQPVEKPDEFVQQFRNRGPKDCLVVMGSMYLLGEIKTILQNKKIA
jgi:dihydrofolate synthase/folylpolyglutamate synthase